MKKKKEGKVLGEIDVVWGCMLCIASWMDAWPQVLGCIGAKIDKYIRKPNISKYRRACVLE